MCMKIKILKYLLLVAVLLSSVFLIMGCFNKQSHVFIDFQSFGETIYSEKAHNFKIDYIPTNLTEPGYSFDGWFYDEELKVPFNQNALKDYIQENSAERIMVYAKWTAIEYNITYELNGGSNNINNPNNYTINSPSFQIFEPTREGFEFFGWSCDGLLDPQLELTINNGTIGNKKLVANWQFLIKNENDFMYYSQNETLWSTNVKLMNNINLSGLTCTSIGINGTAFSAVFDGNNFTIHNIGVTANDFNSGLFGFINNAKIKNLNIASFSTSGSVNYYQVGCLIGQSKNSIVENCSVSAFISSSFRITGGIIGKAQNTMIVNCNFTGEISCYGHPNNFYCGGIVGYAENTEILKSFVNAQLKATSIYMAWVGGIVGIGKGVTINQCYTTQKISANIQDDISIGGIAGQLEESSILINCYSISQVSATTKSTYSTSGIAYAGGLVGVTYSTEINNSYYVGTVSAFAKEYAKASYAGGLVGYAGGLDIKNCFVAGSVEAVSEHGLSKAIAGRDLGKSILHRENIFIDSNQTISANQHNSSLNYSNNFIGKIADKSEILLNIYETWDSSIWNANNENYPTLKCFNK